MIKIINSANYAALHMMQQPNFGIAPHIKAFSENITTSKMGDSMMHRQIHNIQNMVEAQTKATSLVSNAMQIMIKANSLSDSIKASAFMKNTIVTSRLLETQYLSNLMKPLSFPALRLKSWADLSLQTKAYTNYSNLFNKTLFQCRYSDSLFDLKVSKHIIHLTNSITKQMNFYSRILSTIAPEELEIFWERQTKKLEKISYLREVHNALKSGNFQIVDEFLKYHLGRKSRYSESSKHHYEPDLYKALLIVFTRLWETKTYKEIKTESINHYLNKSIKLDQNKIIDEDRRFGFKKTSSGSFIVFPEQVNKELNIYSVDDPDFQEPMFCQLSSTPQSLLDKLLLAEYREEAIKFLENLNSDKSINENQRKLTAQLQVYIASNDTDLIDFSLHEQKTKYNLTKRAKRYMETESGRYFRGDF